MYKDKFTQNGFEASVFFRYDLESLIQTAAEICNKLNTIFDLDEMVEKAARLIQQTLGYDKVTFYLLDPTQKKVTSKIMAGANHGQIIQSFPSESDIGLARHAAEQNCTIQIGDLAKEAPDHYHSKPIDIRSELHIPLERDQNVIGVMSLGSTAPYMFDETDIVFVLKALATQITLSIDRLYRVNGKTTVSLNPDTLAIGDQKPQSHVVNVQDILPGIQSLAGIGEVFDKIVRGVVEGLGYTGAMLAVLDDENKTLSVQAIAYNSFIHQRNWQIVEKLFGIRIIGNSVSLAHNKGNLGVQTCLIGRAKITHDLYDLFQPVIDAKLSRRIQQTIGVKSCISIPLRVGGRIVGNLYAGNRKSDFSKDDLDALHFFVTNAAIAVQNSILFEQVNQKLALREAELTQLRSIEKTINSSLDLREVLKHILNGALDLIKAEYGQVVLTGKYATDLVHQVSFPEVLDSFNEIKFGITQAMMQDKKPKLINNTADEPDIDLLESDQGSYSKIMKSLLGVPILLGDELIGVINIASQEVEAFNAQSLDMLEQLAVQAAIAINNAYQFKAEREMRERFANVAQVVAMGDMAGNMVHSINNGVGSIRADIKYLKRQIERNRFNQEELVELLDDMLANAEGTLSMAENIRKPFQPSPQEAINVNECIENVLTEKHEELSNVIVIEELADNLPPVMATRQLELVFENLLNNALVAMKGQVRGVLKFATSRSTDGQWVEVAIQDSGPGLAETLNPDDIFKLGVSGRKGGLGYGLWWCDTFLKRWGGQIQFVEETRRGCKFLIRLPIAAAALER